MASTSSHSSIALQPPSRPIFRRSRAAVFWRWPQTERPDARSWRLSMVRVGWRGPLRSRHRVLALQTPQEELEVASSFAHSIMAQLGSLPPVFRNVDAAQSILRDAGAT